MFIYKKTYLQRWLDITLTIVSFSAMNSLNRLTTNLRRMFFCHYTDSEVKLCIPFHDAEIYHASEEKNKSAEFLSPILASWNLMSQRCSTSMLLGNHSLLGNMPY